ncbi:MAG: ABC transporter permease [Kiritimatiellae bacterium]|nr:ABC transporter permease [Kiritimatiellia bacterium]
MLKYALRRLWQTIPTTFGILLLAFVLFNVVGGSPAETLLGKNATAEAIAAFNAKWGYDRPLPVQFVRYLGDLCRGDLGFSIEHQEPVIDVLARGVGPSLSLTVPILVLGVLVGLALALAAAARRGRALDHAVLFGSTALMSVNYVVWVLAGQFFLAYKAGLFPVWGYESAYNLVLPVFIGVVSSLGADVRFFRAAILDEIYRPYVLAARAKGLPGRVILVRHVLRNALVPIVTYVSLSIPHLFTGSLLLESFFGIPGLGSVAINAIHSSDMAVVRAVVVIGALLYQFVNLATDLLYAALDPRVTVG